MHIQPYLFFEGRCDEAIEFYREAVGAETVRLMRFKDIPGPHQPGMITPGTEDKVMHAQLRVGETTILLSDGRCNAPAKFQGFSLTLGVSDEAEASRRFAALSAGGQVQMPLTKTFFAKSFGMVVDRFGVTWMVIVEN